MNCWKSGNKSTGALSKFWVVEFVNQYDTEEQDDASEEEVSFRGKDIGSFLVGDPQSIF